MTDFTINKETIIKRINGIQEEIAQMKKLGDFDVFLSAIKKVLEKPEYFNLKIEG